MAYDTPYVQKDNSGSIFRNDKKEKDTHPDGKGSATIDGVEYWVSSWNAQDKNGNSYRKLAFTRKNDTSFAKPAPAPQRMAPKSQDAFKARQLAPQRDELDSDLPPF